MHCNQLVMSTSLVALLIGCTEDGLPAEPPEGAEPLVVQPILVAALPWGFDVRKRLVIRDPATWAAAWQDMVRGIDPVPSAPEVDFETHLVLVASMGLQMSLWLLKTSWPKRTLGYAINIDEAQTMDGNAWISVTESSVARGCWPFDFLTRRVAVVAVPRYEGQTVFIERIDERDCDY